MSRAGRRYIAGLLVADNILDNRFTTLTGAIAVTALTANDLVNFFGSSKWCCWVATPPGRDRKELGTSGYQLVRPDRNQFGWFGARMP